MKIMKKSSHQFLERKILYNIVQSIPIICNQHLSALTCTYIHDTANISKLQQTCFHPIFASECFRAFSGQSFCTVLFPYQAVVSRTWFPYQFFMCCQLSRKCSCTYFGILLFQAQNNYRFPLGIIKQQIVSSTEKPALQKMVGLQQYIGACLTRK